MREKSYGLGVYKRWISKSPSLISVGDGIMAIKAFYPSKITKQNNYSISKVKMGF